MKNPAPLLLLLLLASACGPKEIGQGHSEPASLGGHRDVADQMRQPFTGAAPAERMLYFSNKPEVMEQSAKLRISQFNRHAGIAPEDPAYRETPKTASPFRE